MNYVECKLDPDTPKVTIKSPLSFDDVRRFFSNPEECDIKVITLGRNNNVQLHEKVRVKTYYGCSLFFSQSGYTYNPNYFYVYLSLLQQALVWTKFPLSEADIAMNVGRLGEHITIGLNDKNKLDIHETRYRTIRSNKYIFIAEKLPSIYYSVNPKTNHLVADRNAKSHQAAVIWNDIAAFKYDGLYAEATQMNGGGVGSKYRPLTIKEIFEIIDKRWQLVPNPVVQNQVYFLRIPHIPKSKEYAAIRRIQRYINSQNNIRTIQLISDYNLKASVLMIGELAQK